MANKRSGIIQWFIDNHVAANILMLLFIFGGIVSIKSMRTETFPSIDPRLVTVSVVYPGANPYEVADAITGRIEDELVGIEGVKRISSQALEGYGVVNVELFDFVDANDVYNDVDTAVNGLVDFPPQDAQRPIVKKARVTPQVLTLALHGDIDELGLKYWAKLIEDEIRELPGVALTQLSGIRDYQISIEIKQDSLRKYNLTFDDVLNAVKGFSKDVPAGTVESKSGDILLRIEEKKYRGDEFEDVVIRTLDDGSSLKLGQVANIVDAFEDINLVSKFNNERAAFIEVKRSNSDDTLQVADKVKNYLDKVNLPSGLHLSLQEDKTVNLKDRISLMLRNGIIGFALVFLILLLFLDIKLAFWTSAAIPISFLGGLMILNMMGYSINMISLFALIVVLGIVVDDGIITGESIFEAQDKMSGDLDATRKGVLAVIAPVTIGVATTMAAFGPLIFSTGTLGQIIGIIPVVVISILAVSLIEAYFILPAHLSDFKRWNRGIISDVRNKFANKLVFFINNKLEPAIKLVLRFRYAAIAAFLAVAIITVGLVKSHVIRFVFFPQVESSQILVKVHMPVGTPFAVTKNVMLEIEDHIDKVKQEVDGVSEISPFESVSVNIGEIPSSTAPGGRTAGQSGSNVGQVKVSLVPSDFRKFSSYDIEGKIRTRIEKIAAIERLEFQSSLIGNDPDIEIEISHNDEKQLQKATESLKENLKAIAGTKEVADSFEEGKLEYVFKLNAQGLALGLTPAELGRQLRYAYFGAEALRFARDSSEIIVYVRYPKDQRESLVNLLDTRIYLPDGKEVPLEMVADIKKQHGYSQILTVNGKRIVSVTADADLNVTTPNEIISYLEEKTLPELKASFQGLSYSFEGKSKEQKDDLASLGSNMLIALMLIYVLLGAQLRSYVQPFIIMSAIPFGVVGAILGHFVLGYDLTFISMFGVVALMGVVVNDSVVLMDYLNKCVKAGKSVEHSAILAVKRRFRPILLTSLSTSLGLLPILLETSLQARFLIPMVVSLAMGILFATVVILFLIPCLLLVMEDIKKLGR